MFFVPALAMAVEQAAVAGEVQALLERAPGLALRKAGEIGDDVLRGRMRRAAWVAVASRDPAEAAKLLPGVAGERWLGDVSFAQSLDVAWHTVGPEPELSRRLLIASAVQHPEAALREVRQYIELPYGLEIWEAAAREAPDQVVALESLSRPLLERTRDERLRALQGLFALPMAERQRAALAGGETGLRTQELFARMVDGGRRHGRRVMGAQLLLEGGEGAGLRGKDLAALASGANTEEEREALLRMAKRGGGAFAGVESARPEDLRALLALLVESGAESGWLTAGAAARAMEDVQSGDDALREAVRAAVIGGALGSGAARKGALEVLARQDGALAKLVRERMEGSKLFPAQREFPAAELFAGGVCVERYLFHNDDDGVESFESFLGAYAGEPGWRVRREAGYVELTGTGTHGRRIVIFANVPEDLQRTDLQGRRAEIEGRQEAVSRALRDRKLTPAVIVHRGHDYHFEVTRRYLHEDARLVFLGSCRGMQAVEDVATRCRRAQMIATRGVGTKAVNDPFLKALNRELSRGRTVLDWEEFWQSLPAAVAGNEHFREYVRPHRNEAAIFLAGWYRQATGSR